MNDIFHLERILSVCESEASDRVKVRRIYRMAATAIAMARDSAETACPAPVPKDCQARAESIAQPVDKSGPSHD